jgi:hypothetical protein
MRRPLTAQLGSRPNFRCREISGPSGRFGLLPDLTHSGPRVGTLAIGAEAIPGPDQQIPQSLLLERAGFQ